MFIGLSDFQIAARLRERRFVVFVQMLMLLSYFRGLAEAPTIGRFGFLEDLNQNTQVINVGMLVLQWELIGFLHLVFIVRRMCVLD